MWISIDWKLSTIITTGIFFSLGSRPRAAQVSEISKLDEAVIMYAWLPCCIWRCGLMGSQSMLNIIANSNDLNACCNLETVIDNGFFLFYFSQREFASDTRWIGKWCVPGPHQSILDRPPLQTINGVMFPQQRHQGIPKCMWGVVGRCWGFHFILYEPTQIDEKSLKTVSLPRKQGGHLPRYCTEMISDVWSSTRRYRFKSCCR